MVDLELLNLFLDALIKTVVILLIGYVFLILRNMKRLVNKAERSVESVENTAESVERLIKWGRILPFTRGDKE